MSKLNLTLFFVMIFFIILNIMPQLIQAVLLGLPSLFSIFMWIKNRKINKWVTYFFFVLIFVLLLSLIRYSSISLYYFLCELKIVVLFTLPPFFYLILPKRDYKIFLLGFYKIFSLLIFTTVLYGFLVKGILRFTGFLSHSIYLSVGLVLLLSYLFYDLRFKWKIISLINVLMLGSSSGVLVFFIVFLLKLRVSTLRKIIPTVAALSISYWYIVEFGGREILNGGIWNIDRIQIFLAVVNYTKENFNVINYFIGFGIGVPLKNFSFNNSFVSDEILGFIDWFMGFANDGVYSFTFHNEFLRIFYNFGIIGLVIILTYLYKNLDKTTFIALTVACLTNTIIYSTVGLFIISLLISSKWIQQSMSLQGYAVPSRKCENKKRSP